MSYKAAVAEAAQALVRGEDANRELARLTYENTNRQHEKRDPNKVSHSQWSEDVRAKSGRTFSESTSSRYARMHESSLSADKLVGQSWTEDWYDEFPRDTHPKVAERGAKYTAEKGTVEAAVEAAKIALARPEVADRIVADNATNLNVVKARQRHDNDARAIGEVKDPNRKTARHTSEQRDDIYEIVKFANWLLRQSDTWRTWVWTPDLQDEWEDTIDKLRGATDLAATVSTFDQELADLLGDN